jgi:hypothetical protein
MNIVAIPVTMIAGAYRRQGWRATLQDSGVIVWRCACDRPHYTTTAADVCGLGALRARLGRRGMRVWAATYRRQPQFTQEETERMDEERSLTLLEIQTNPSLPSWENPEAFPTSADAARAAIVEYERILLEEPNWEVIRRTKRVLEHIILAFREHTDVRHQAEISLLVGERRIAGEFIQAQKDGLVGVAGRPPKNQLGSGRFSIAEVFGKAGRNYVSRLRNILPFTYDQIREKGFDLHLVGKDATLHALSELILTEQTRERRRASLYAEPLPEGMEYRIGNNREMFDDIEDESIPVIITDPPYGRDSEENFEWLGRFAGRVLMPGGSLICYTGTGMVLRDGLILARHLNYKWMGILLHAEGQKLLGAGIRSGYKPIFWFTKGPNRRIVHGRKTLVPDVLNDRRAAVSEEEFLEQTDSGRALSTKDKSMHGWAQGDAGVRVWAHHLSAPGETILDPFAGSGTWGRIIANMGRHWIGCDIEDGGTESVMADVVDEAAD